MKIGRRVWLVIAVALSSMGCRAAGTGTLSLFPRVPLMQASLDKDEFIAQHNRNAESIQSLQASPSISVARRLHTQFHLDGHMALERPHNFRLELTAMNKTQADIGSNDEEFWFWFATETALYWCNYADLDASPLAMTYQPDWIIEAMGLKPISPIEAEQIQMRKGREPGTTALVFPPTRSGTESYRRWLIVSNRERRIKELQIYTAKEPATLIARAVPSQYKDYPVKPDEYGTTKTCYLPDNLVLEWKGDQSMKLEVQMLEVKLNQFKPSLRNELFTEPKIEGYPRKNLAELSRGSRSQGQRASSTRRTMPPPSSRSGVELGRPAPLADDDGPVVPKLGGTTAPSSATPPPALPPLEALVGSPVPTAPDSPAVQAARAEQYPPSGFTIER